MTAETIVILDFGGQYKELIARRARECGVFSMILPYTTPIEQIRALSPCGIIFTGGPSSVYAENAPTCSPELFTLGVPILGICYGMQLLCHLQGGKVTPCIKSEYGIVEATLEPSSLFASLAGQKKVLMSHSDQVIQLPAGCRRIASTEHCPIAAFENTEKGLYGVQFHPEVEHTTHGVEMIRHFLYAICQVRGGYCMENYLTEQIGRIRETVGDKRVLLGLSGGVDSAVCAALLAEAVPGQLTCIYVDHGLMRKNETDGIRAAFASRDLDFHCVDAEARFLSALAGITDPEEKRKCIGRLFIETFTEEAKKIGEIGFLAQGTIYPDVVESGHQSTVIKSHHNVGGLPENLEFIGVIEPLRSLFKDEVRKLGRILGLPASLVNRQPFPGPGLAIRVIGAVTKEKLVILREADAIFREELTQADCEADQFFAVLTDTKSVGVMGDGRTYDYTLALRAVYTNDFMTCEFARLPWEVLSRASARITNEVKGINRIVYDITSKPPATIEWE